MSGLSRSSTTLATRSTHLQSTQSITPLLANTTPSSIAMHISESDSASIGHKRGWHPPPMVHTNSNKGSRSGTPTTPVVSGVAHAATMPMDAPPAMDHTQSAHPAMQANYVIPLSKVSVGSIDTSKYLERMQEKITRGRAGTVANPSELDASAGDVTPTGPVPPGAEPEAVPEQPTQADSQGACAATGGAAYLTDIANMAAASANAAFSAAAEAMSSVFTTVTSSTGATPAPAPVEGDEFEGIESSRRPSYAPTVSTYASAQSRSSSPLPELRVDDSTEPVVVDTPKLAIVAGDLDPASAGGETKAQQKKPRSPLMLFGMGSHKDYKESREYHAPIHQPRKVSAPAPLSPSSHHHHHNVGFLTEYEGDHFGYSRGLRKSATTTSLDVDGGDRSRRASGYTTTASASSNSSRKSKQRQSGGTPALIPASLPPAPKASSEKQMRKLFQSVLLPDERLIDDFACAYQPDKGILAQGKIYLTNHHFLFHANILGFQTDVITKVEEIVDLQRAKTALFIPNAIIVALKDRVDFYTSFLNREHTLTVMRHIIQRYWTERNLPIPSALLYSDTDSIHLPASSSSSASPIPSPESASGSHYYPVPATPTGSNPNMNSLPRSERSRSSSFNRTKGTPEPEFGDEDVGRSRSGRASPPQAATQSFLLVTSTAPPPGAPVGSPPQPPQVMAAAIPIPASQTETIIENAAAAAAAADRGSGGTPPSSGRDTPTGFGSPAAGRKQLHGSRTFTAIRPSSDNLSGHESAGHLSRSTTMNGKLLRKPHQYPGAAVPPGPHPHPHHHDDSSSSSEREQERRFLAKVSALDSTALEREVRSQTPLHAQKRDSGAFHNAGEGSSSAAEDVGNGARPLRKRRSWGPPTQLQLDSVTRTLGADQPVTPTGGWNSDGRVTPNPLHPRGKPRRMESSSSMGSNGLPRGRPQPLAPPAESGPRSAPVDGSLFASGMSMLMGWVDAAAGAVAEGLGVTPPSTPLSAGWAEHHHSQQLLAPPPGTRLQRTPSGRNLLTLIDAQGDSFTSQSPGAAVMSPLAHTPPPASPVPGAGNPSSAAAAAAASAAAATLSAMYPRSSRRAGAGHATAYHDQVAGARRQKVQTLLVVLLVGASTVACMLVAVGSTLVLWRVGQVVTVLEEVAASGLAGSF
ncbi:hypothetical protein HDU96_010245 [Phlyctochytrium bullatum]|nr:hypothetical protein HDU96_010245 [Phlyctochytrium bullatum]